MVEVSTDPLSQLINVDIKSIKQYVYRVYLTIYIIMARKSITIKAAWIGAAAVIVAAIIMVFGPYILPERPASFSGSEVERIIANSNRFGEPVATGFQSKRINLASDSLIVVRSYNMLKDTGQIFQIGLCPEAPCFEIRIDGYDLSEADPLVRVALGGKWEGFLGHARGIVMEFPLKNGCGFTFLSPHYDLFFEIINDRVSSTTAWAAIYSGSINPNSGGFMIKEIGCD